MSDAKTYDGLSGLVALAGIHEGIVPFIGKIFGWHQFLSLPLHLPAPAWWIVSIAAIVVALALLEMIDQAKKRALSE